MSLSALRMCCAGLIAAGMLICGPAAAQKRVALVIGNNAYKNLPAEQQLEKAVNDARAVGDALAALGFEVIRGENVGRQAMVDRFDELTQRLVPGDTAFFFFAGHGVAIGGGNYILPTDIPDISSGQDTRLARAALGENDIVSDLQARGVRVAVVVLDSCRNNPFRRPGVRAIGGERGLARTDPVRGVFSLYSAGIGQSALDRLSDADPNPNSVFTRVLVPALAKPGLDLGALAIEVREEVARLASTVGQDQRPAYYDETIGGRIYLAGLPKPDLAPAAAPSPAEAAEHAWEAAKDTTSIAVLEAYVKRFADSFYADLARARIEELRKTQVAALPAAIPPAPPPSGVRTLKFEKTFASIWFETVLALPDGGYVAAGREAPENEGYPKKVRPDSAIVVRLDRAGNTAWRKMLGGPKGGQVKTVSRLPNGHLLFTGFKNASANELMEWAFELDENGSLVSDKAFGESRTKLWRSIVPLASGRYVVIGSDVLYTGTPIHDLFVLDTTGKTVVHKKLPESALDCEWVSLALPESGFVTASAHSLGGKFKEMRFRRFDDNGNVLLDRPITIKASGDICPRAIQATADGGFLVLGLLDDSAQDSAWVVRIDGQGQALWEQTYAANNGAADAGSAMPYTAALTPGGGLAVGGCFLPPDTNGGLNLEEGWLVRADANGNPVWDARYPHANGETIRAIASTPDGGLVAAALIDRRCAEYSGVVDGGNGFIFTVPPEDMARR